MVVIAVSNLFGCFLLTCASATVMQLFVITISTTNIKCVVGSVYIYRFILHVHYTAITVHWWKVFWKLQLIFHYCTFLVTFVKCNDEFGVGHFGLNHIYGAASEAALVVF